MYKEKDSRSVRSQIRYERTENGNAPKEFYSCTTRISYSSSRPKDVALGDQKRSIGITYGTPGRNASLALLTDSRAQIGQRIRFPFTIPCSCHSRGAAHRNIFLHSLVMHLTMQSIRATMYLHEGYGSYLYLLIMRLSPINTLRRDIGR
jgi:hypothetical protein